MSASVPHCPADREPLVSIIMNCFNGAKYLRPAIESVRAQTYSSWELIFWDNQSTDDSVAIAESYGDARIKIQHAARHVPLGAARNEAVALARGEWIAFLDTDDLWHPEKLRRQMDYLGANPSIDFLYTNLATFEQGEDWRRMRGRHRGPQPTGMVFVKFLRTYPVNLQTVVVRSKVLWGLPERFAPDFEVAEEFDLFLRLLYRHEAGYLPQVLVGYRLHPQQASRTKIGLYATEVAQILHKLQALYPESAREHRRDYAFLEGKIAYYHARAALHQNDRAAARQLLAPWKWHHWRFFSLYLLLCLPGNLFAAVHRITGRYH